MYQPQCPSSNTLTRPSPKLPTSRRSRAQPLLARRHERHAPGRVERATRDQPLHEVAVRLVDVDESIACAGDVVFALSGPAWRS